MTPFNHLEMQPIERDFDESCGLAEESNNFFSLEELVDTTDDESNASNVSWEDVLVDE